MQGASDNNYLFPLPQENKDIWNLRSQILDTVCKKRDIFSSFEQLTIWMDQLRQPQIKEDIQSDKYQREKSLRYINLEKVFQGFNAQEQNNFLISIIPSIYSMAQESSKIQLKAAIQKEKDCSKCIYTMSRIDVGRIVSLMFLCLIKDEKSREFRDFRQLFSSGVQVNDLINKRRQEKIKCFIDYLSQINSSTEREKKEVVTYERVKYDKLRTIDEWREDLKKIKLKSLIAEEFQTIERCQNSLQVDFANESIGGGVLGDGLVQEEIRFCISPELMPCLILFPSLLKPNEVILVREVKQYSTYQGYSNQFRHQPLCNQVSRINIRNKPESIVAIDAKCFSLTENQFSSSNLVRELNKAYFGFNQAPEINSIASGKWGCGAFNGVFDLKFIIQWIAASACNKKLILCTFQDEKSTKEVNECASIFKSQKADKLLEIIFKYVNSKEQNDGVTLTEFIIQTYSN